MNNLEYIYRIIIDQLCFLELTDDSILNPDAAIQQTEQIAATLIEIDAKGKLLFKEACSRYAKESVNTDISRSQFIEELPENLGIWDG